MAASLTDTAAEVTSVAAGSEQTTSIESKIPVVCGPPGRTTASEPGPAESDSGSFLDNSKTVDRANTRLAQARAEATVISNKAAASGAATARDLLAEAYFKNDLAISANGTATRLSCSKGGRNCLHF